MNTEEYIKLLDMDVFHLTLNDHQVLQFEFEFWIGLFIKGYLVTH